MHTLAMFSIGGYEWLIVLVIALLIFGPRLPRILKGVGGGVREFRQGMSGADDDDAGPRR